MTKQIATEDDPLALRGSTAGRPDGEEQSGPTRHVCALYTRLMNRDYADSVEIKISLLSQMLFLIYEELKEHVQR